MIDNINIRGPILICFQPGIDILRSTAKYGLFGNGLVLGLSVSRVVWLLERGVTHVTTNVVSNHVRTNEPSSPLFRHFTLDPPIMVLKATDSHSYHSPRSEKPNILWYTSSQASLPVSLSLSCYQGLSAGLLYSWLRLCSALVSVD